MVYGFLKVRVAKCHGFGLIEGACKKKKKPYKLALSSFMTNLRLNF